MCNGFLIDFPHGYTFDSHRESFDIKEKCSFGYTFDGYRESLYMEKNIQF